MSIRPTGSRQTAAFYKSYTRTGPFVCLSCRLSSRIRNYASAATAQVATEHDATTQFTSPPCASPAPQRLYTINGGIVLSRPPLLTPPLHPFESSYFLYQRRLNERLVLPFSQYFYYKRGTPAFEDWRAKRRARGGVATRDVGTYNAYTDTAWNDEILVGDKMNEQGEVVKRLLADESREARSLGAREEQLTEEGGEVKQNGKDPMAGLRRQTEADRAGNVKSLERKLDRTLYLLVRRGEKGLKGERERSCWGFPCSELMEKEGIREAAERSLAQACGVDMNTWIVASHPIGHFVYNFTPPPEPQPDSPMQPLVGEKTFFVKGRIMAGQANIAESFLGINDFKWLAKEEIKEHVGVQYWSAVKNMLVEQ